MAPMEGDALGRPGLQRSYVSSLPAMNWLGARDLSRRNPGLADPRREIARPLRPPTLLRTEVRTGLWTFFPDSRSETGMLIHGSAAGMPPFRGGFQAPGQPEGLPDISRGLSASDTPGTPSKPNRTLEGCQNCALLEWHILRPRISGTIPGSIPIPFHNRCVELSKSAIVVFLHPSASGVREISLSGYRGYRPCAPRPPANFWQPSGLRRSGLFHWNTRGQRERAAGPVS